MSNGRVKHETGVAIPARGVASELIAELVPPLPDPPVTKLAMVGVGLKMHFVWEDAVANFRAAVNAVQAALADQPFELVAPDEPFESPDALLAALEAARTEGVAGVILFHASYTAGEIGSQVGRWLAEQKLPLLSWAYPEKTGGRLTANSLCCQNFLLNAFTRLGVRYQWLFKPIDSEAVTPVVRRFGRSVRARQRFVNGRTLMVGASRVPGFYDAECDELAVMKRFGLRFDRMDLVQVVDHGRRFTEEQLRPIHAALTDAKVCGRNDVPDEQFFGTLRLGLATLDLAAQEGHIGCAIRCWPALFDYFGYAADGAIALINDQGLPCADESDMNGLVSMLAMALLSDGAAAPTLMDISRLDPERNRLGFWHCGGSATRLRREGTKHEARRHSILENADEATAVGMLIESLLKLGPVTVTRYMSPDASRAFTFEGDVVDSPMAFRGAYAEVEPVGHTAEQVMGSILDHGLDHHWIMGRGRFADDLHLLNHWLGVEAAPVSNAGGSTGLSAG